MPKKQNNRSFTESFDHVEPYAMDTVFTETFDHEDPPSMSLEFVEQFEG